MSENYLHIQASKQLLSLYQDKQVVAQFQISSAKKGLGEREGSEKTPRGWHEICEKIGDDCPFNTVFVARQPTGEIYSPALAQQFPHRDWILTRILWLTGLEAGFNREGEVDSRRRYIYIHGCPDTAPVGMPLSHGCIRMRNVDVMDLFNQVKVGTRVLIEE